MLATYDFNFDMPDVVELPCWSNNHVHYRQNRSLMRALAQEQLNSGADSALAMGNTLPVVGRVTEDDSGNPQHWSIRQYRARVEAAFCNNLSHLTVPLYLTPDTTPKLIEEGVKSGWLTHFKHMPPNGTTNSEFSAPFQHFVDNGVFEAAADCGVIGCFHGEVNGLPPHEYYDRHTNAEMQFYERSAPLLVEKFPKLRWVAEHITTAEAAAFVQQAPDTVGATVTPQHLLKVIGDFMLTKNMHLICMPWLKYEADRAALRAAVTGPKGYKFFAGDDSAPHPSKDKCTCCGCAAGCYMGAASPILYAQGWQEAGHSLNNPASLHSYISFMSMNGPAFHGFDPATEQMRLLKKPSIMRPTRFINDRGRPDKIVPLPLALSQDFMATKGSGRVDRVQLPLTIERDRPRLLPKLAA